MATKRKFRIDSFRLYAMFLIVYAHIQFFGDLPSTPLTSFLTLVIGIGVRWTIPFFFMTAGYFFSDKMIRENADAFHASAGYTGRLAKVFVFWCVIYGLLNPLETMHVALTHPLRILLIGTSEHLWYLPSLILSVWIFVALRGHKYLRPFLALGILAFTIGLLGGPYRATPLGFSVKINPRNGFFFSALFFGLGSLFRIKPPRMSMRTRWLVAAGGFALYCLEAWFLYAGWGLVPQNHDYLLSSIPWGIGMFLIAIGERDSNLDRKIGEYGRWTLGVYVAHYAVQMFLEPAGKFLNPAAWELLFPVLVFSFSLFLTVILARTRFGWTVGAPGATNREAVAGVNTASRSPQP